jgi:heavy metal sensor kinase
MQEEQRPLRILVVEDEAKVARAHREGLERERYEVVVAPTGEEGFFLVSAEEFDLVLLDRMLPGRDGLQVLSTLRKRGLQTPVLILTARDAIEDRVEGLDKGADDYLVKPFAFPELLARVPALLRRGRPEPVPQLKFLDLELDLGARRARRHGQLLDLTAREFELLEYLLRYKEQVVSREMLARHVWKETARATPLDNVVLGGLLALYAAVASVFLFLSLREDFDRNLLQDVETVEGMLEKGPNGHVSLHASHPDTGEPRIGHFIEVWSPKGKLLYRSPALQNQTLGGPPGPDEGVDEPSPVAARLEHGSRIRLASSIYSIEDQPVILRVAYSEERLWHELGEFAGVLLLGFPIAVLLAGFGGYALARKALSPIDAMATQAKRISAERLDERLPVENPEDELSKLGTVFNDMLGRLQAGFDQLRRFTADASHELRTPLTAMRSVGEVALQDQRSPAEYRDVIGSMLEEVDRLTRLSESLLSLSRADAGYVHLRREEISLFRLAKEAISSLEVLAEEKHQRIYLQGNETLLVSADRLILRQAIVNLLDNAIKYSPTESRILVFVQNGGNGRVFLDVVDTGPGIPKEHQPYVFDRFYRVDKARTREWGGAGLGLSIAHWAIGAHNGEMTLESKEGHGSTFRVSLPTIPHSPTSPSEGDTP